MKKLLPVVVLVILFGAGGFFYLNSRGMVPKLSGSNTTNQAGSGIVSSIRDALTGSKSIKCVYTDEQGIQTTSYVKNGAVRVMMTATGDSPDNILMKDQTMHMWSAIGKTGFIYKLEKSTDKIAEDSEKGEKVENGEGAKNGDDQQESVLAEIEKYKNSCKAEAVDDSLFVIPTDVKFQDMDSLRQQMMQGQPQIPEQNETGEATGDREDQ